MRQIYILTCFLLPLFSFSQLSISPGGNSGNYLYVESTFLFVEDHIELRKNPDNDIASLYLRKEAQLLQGTQKNLNIGDGNISVYQEGNASAYTYNYWGLPVKTNSSDILINDYIFEPTNELLSKKPELSTGFNGLANPLNISRIWLYKFSGNRYSDWKSLANNFELLPGEGFTMKGVDGKNMETVIYGVPNNPGNEQRYDFRGLPNSGEIILPVKKEIGVLVGNPYPSALNLDKFLISNKDITGIAYFWDSKNIYSHNLKDYEGGYGTYSPAGGDNGYVPPLFLSYSENANVNGITGGIGEHYARQFLPIAQGFIVRGKEDGEIVFKNEYREFVKENVKTSQFKSSGEISFLKLNIEFENLYIRQLMLIDDSNSTNLIDHAKDAQAFAVAPTDFFFNVEDVPVIINVQPIDNREEIPFLINNPIERIVKMEIYSSENFQHNLFIHDVKKNLYFPFENGKLNFKIPAGTFTNEYKLAFSNPSILVDEIIKTPPTHISKSENYSVFQDMQNLLLKIYTPQSKIPSKVELLDIRGRIVLKSALEKDINYFEIPTSNLSNGVYILKIYSISGSLFSKKVIISN